MTRGQRNNNPLNIRRSSDQWKGMSDAQTDPDFVVFRSMYYGIRAAVIILRNYYKKYHLCTIQEIISRWAPLSENDTHRYVQYVSDTLKKSHLTTLDMNDPTTIAHLVQAMAVFESGTYLKIDEVELIARDLIG